MRYLWSLAVVVALAGCASADPVIESSPTPVAVSTEPSTPRPTPEPSPTASPTPTAEPTPDGPPKQCRDYKSSDSMTDKTATKAAAKAALPPTVVLMHVQTIHSVDEPGMNEAVARVCSYPMTEDELIEIATAIAVAVKPSKVSDDLAVLVVSAWHPDGDSIAQGEAVQSDYQLFTWEPGSPMASNWE